MWIIQTGLEAWIGLIFCALGFSFPIFKMGLELEQKPCPALTLNMAFS